MTTQAPHLVRTVLAMLSGIAESKIRVVGGDIGGGFGNKVPVYPGYVVAIVASIVTGVPIKWIESRIDNISTTGFARDYHGVGELAADEGRPHQGPALHRAGRPRRVQFARVGDQAAGRACSRSAPAPMRSRTPTAASMRSTPTRRRAAWPTAARCA